MLFLLCNGGEDSEDHSSSGGEKPLWKDGGILFETRNRR